MAEVVCVQRKAPVDGLALFAREMFHGHAERPGAAYPRLQYREGDDLIHPLELTANVFEMTGVRQPILNWIVPEVAKGALEGIPHIAFLKVRMKKLFREPYDLAVDPPLVEALEDLEEVWELYENDPSLSSALGAWYELVLPQHMDMAPNYFQGAAHLRVEEQWSSGTIDLQVSQHLLEEYPLFSRTGVFARPDIFALAEPYVDMRYFAVERVSF